MRIALTIAGSDSGGGAGIQADLKTFHRFQTFGTSVITAITAQNTRGVAGWQAVDPELVATQLHAVAEDLRPHAIKTGMLGNEAVITAVASGIKSHALRPFVLDPVMVASSGDRLLDAGAEGAIRTKLFPLATLVTPNIHEAALLCGHPVNTVPEMEIAARILVEDQGVAAALVKGGHLEGGDAVDVFFDGQLRHFRHPRINTTHTHGTGCTLSSAITANLAHGASLAAAVEIGLDFVHRALLLAPELGSGHGPLNHFA